MNTERDNKAHLSVTTCVQMKIHLLDLLQWQQSSWKVTFAVLFHLHHYSYIRLL